MEILKEHKRGAKKVAQYISFLLLAYLYLYIGYHNKEYLFDISTFKFIPNKGVNQAEYVGSIKELSNVINVNSRWFSSLIVMLSLSIVSSVMVWVLFLNKQSLYISLVYYFVLLLLCGCYIVVFSLVSHSHLGYEIARFVKDNFIHSPFVFIILVASLKVFKI